MTSSRKAFAVLGAAWLLLCGGFALAAPDAPADAPPARAEPAQPGNNAAIWRQVRSGEAHSTSARGVEVGVLVQSGGQTWRALRPWIATAGSALLLLCVAALALFYRWRGPIEVSARPTGRPIQRFDTLDRWAHWTMGISFVVLGITGLALSFGKYVLLPVIGYTLFSLLAAFAKSLHNFVGPVFMLALAFFIVRFLSDNLPRLYDIQWLLKFGGMFSRQHVPSGRFNAGEKTLFWGLVCFFSVVLCASGLVLDFPNFEQGRSVMQLANVVHFVVALLAIAASLFHMYLGTIGMKGAYQAMRGGTVDESWAKEHHEIWYQEVKAGKSRQHYAS